MSRLWERLDPTFPRPAIAGRRTRCRSGAEGRFAEPAGGGRAPASIARHRRISCTSPWTDAGSEFPRNCRVATARCVPTRSGLLALEGTSSLFVYFLHLLCRFAIGILAPQPVEKRPSATSVNSRLTIRTAILAGCWEVIFSGIDWRQPRATHWKRAHFPSHGQAASAPRNNHSAPTKGAGGDL